MPEQNDIDEALLKWVFQYASDNVPLTGLLLMVIFVLPQF
jgi:hypothetical protein